MESNTSKVSRRNCAKYQHECIWACQGYRHIERHTSCGVCDEMVVPVLMSHSLQRRRPALLTRRAGQGLLPHACRLPTRWSLSFALPVCAQVPIPVWNDLDAQATMTVATRIDHLPLDDVIDLGFEYLPDYV